MTPRNTWKRNKILPNRSEFHVCKILSHLLLPRSFSDNRIKEPYERADYMVGEGLKNILLSSSGSSFSHCIKEKKMASPLQKLRKHAGSWTFNIKSTVLKSRSVSDPEVPVTRNKEDVVDNHSKDESIKLEKKGNVQMCVDRIKRIVPNDRGQRRTFKETLALSKEKFCHSVEALKLNFKPAGGVPMTSMHDSEVEL